MTDAEILRQSVPLGFIRRWAGDDWKDGADYLPIFADALEEAGYSDALVLAELRGQTRRAEGWLGRMSQFQAAHEGIPPELYSGDWAETFGPCGEPNRQLGFDLKKAADHLPDVSLAPFSRADVAAVIGMYGTHGDCAEWDGLCVGELKDGRYFVARAGCDTTGWG